LLSMLVLGRKPIFSETLTYKKKAPQSKEGGWLRGNVI
jgi:hypothetical protein